MLVNDKMQEFVIVGSGTNFTASDLGLALNHTANHMNVTQTRLRISQLDGESVDVVDSKSKVMAKWKIIKEVKEDPNLVEERVKHFSQCKLCDLDLNAADTNLCDIFFKLWPGDLHDQLKLLNDDI